MSKKYGKVLQTNQKVKPFQEILLYVPFKARSSMTLPGPACPKSAKPRNSLGLASPKKREARLWKQLTIWQFPNVHRVLQCAPSFPPSHTLEERCFSIFVSDYGNAPFQRKALYFGTSLWGKTVKNQPIWWMWGKRPNDNSNNLASIALHVQTNKSYQPSK